MWFLAIWTSSSENVLCSSASVFSITSLIWGQFSFLSSLCILVISSLPNHRKQIYYLRM
jgi:hypothetical protein